LCFGFLRCFLGTMTLGEGTAPTRSRASRRISVGTSYFFGFLLPMIPSYLRMNRTDGILLALVACVPLVSTACGRLGTISPAFTEGQQFAHSVEFPSRFQIPKVADSLLAGADQYTFRLSRLSPNILLVAACTYPVLNGYHAEPTPRVCSTNSFAIDTEHGFAVTETTGDEWSQAAPLGEKEMDDPYRRTLKQELAKPPFLRAIPFAPGRSQIFEGYRYRGNEYRRRGDWIVSLNFVDSDDGALVVLAGVDKRNFPNQKPAAVDTEVYTRLSGLVTVDVFAGNPSRRLATLDLDCHTNVQVARRRISLVNSRWLAIGLDPFLQKMLLFDFTPAAR